MFLGDRGEFCTRYSSSTFAGITLFYCDSKLLEYSQKSKQVTQMCSMNF